MEKDSQAAIGELGRFAVELGCFSEGEGGHPFVNIRFLIDGEAIGDPEAVSVRGLLESALAELIARLEGQTPDAVERLRELEKAALLRCIEDAYAGGDDGLYRACCFLPMAVEIFDGEKLFLIRGERQDRLVWQAWRGEPAEALLPAGAALAAVRDCLDRLRKSEPLAPSPAPPA